MDSDPFCFLLLLSHPELLQCLRRTSLPVGVDHVPDVLQVLHAHLARPESRCSQVAKAIEERDALTVFGLRAFGPRDVVKHRGALRDAAIHERGAEPVGALAVQPRESAANVDSVVLYSSRMKSMNAGTPASVALPDRS